MNKRPTHMQTEAHTTHGYYLEFAKVVFIENKNVYKPIANGAPATAHETSPQNGAHLYYPLCTPHGARRGSPGASGQWFCGNLLPARQRYYNSWGRIWHVADPSGKKRLLLFLLVLLEEERCAPCARPGNTG